MNKSFRYISWTSFLCLLILTNINFSLAQNYPPPPPMPKSNTSSIPGANVRGRVVYEDSGLPVRYAFFTLVKVDDQSRYYSAKFSKTDENGEFFLEDVEAGNYYPYLKNDGILNPDAYNTLNRFDPDSKKAEDVFQKISINGVGEFQIFVRAKRGSSFSGKVRYFDGEAAVGVKVEALRKISDKFLAYPVGNVTTDDRGYYRFAGLPEGSYTVRVIEPISHKIENIRYYGREYDDGKNLLKTYYPQAETAKEASGFEIFPGQEQASINVTLPERRLFNVSGKVVLKPTGEPLKNFRISFYPLFNIDEGLTYGSSGGIGSGSGTGSSSADPQIPSEWSLHNLPKGKYRMTASQVALYGEQAKNQTKYPDVSKEIEIKDSNVDNVIFEIPVGASIKGTIVSEDGKPLPNYVRILARNTETDDRAYSDIDYSNNDSKKTVTQKKFEINKLTSGKTKLVFNGRDLYIRSISVGDKVITDETLEIEEGETVENVRIVLAGDLGTFKGKIRNYDSTQTLGVILIDGSLTSADSRSVTYYSAVKKDGTYETNAKPGEYRVIIFKQNNSVKTREGADKLLNDLLKNAPTITIRANETQTLDLDMPL